MHILSKNRGFYCIKGVPDYRDLVVLLPIVKEQSRSDAETIQSRSDAETIPSRSDAETIQRLMISK